MGDVTKSVDVDVAVRTAYDQWTQFEEFPSFMEGVERIEQLDDTRLLWVVEVGGATRQFEAEITEQTPDQRIAWTATSGADHGGVVTFHPLTDHRTRVTLQMAFEPDGFVEHAGDALGVVSRRAEADLERFKDFIEGRGEATGGWRGTVDRS